MRKHRFDPISLVIGVLFAGAGIAWMFGEVTFERHDAPWLWALGLVALGLAVLVASIPRGSTEPAEVEQTGNEADQM